MNIIVKSIHLIVSISSIFILLLAEPPIPSGRRLREIVEEKFPDQQLMIGATLNTNHINSEAAKVLDREFSYITPENAFKQVYIHPDPDTWSGFKSEQWVAHVANANQILRMHAPIGPQCSTWAKDDSRTPEELEINMTEFMTELCKHYNGVTGFEYLDVVNETVNNGSWMYNKPGTDEWECPWFIMGQGTDPNQTPVYIVKAFQIANQYGVNLKLIYNHHSGPEEVEDWNLIKETIIYLRSLNLRVDGIGWQAHIDIDWNTSDNILHLIDLIDWAQENNLEFHITEASVYLKKGNTPQTYQYYGYNDESLALQAGVYRSIIDVLIDKSVSGKVGWNTWCVNDNGWQHGGYPDRLYPYIFTTENEAKPAYYAIQEALEGELQPSRPKKFKMK